MSILLCIHGYNNNWTFSIFTMQLHVPIAQCTRVVKDFQKSRLVTQIIVHWLYKIQVKTYTHIVTVFSKTTLHDHFYFFSGLSTIHT